ncbi:hypothetical protein AURDEDRAFT_175968 [Auricularia subglabra TFB-10046 SS5]|nr:hypothetical protein AURDEDRAFT_175968 [Auricularia subglabra TFB-10046 SS5]
MSDAQSALFQVPDTSVYGARTAVLRDPPGAEQSSALRDPVAALPGELGAEVFRHLEFAGRLAVSHTSVSWRQIALSDRQLWTDYTMSLSFGAEKALVDAQTGLLATLLARSNPLPFCLHCGEYVPDAVADLIIEHMDRMKELYLGNFETDGALQCLLDQDVPALKRFLLSGFLMVAARITLSPRWAIRSVSYLRLPCRCIWPANCVFAHLRSYSGFSPEGPSVTVPLSIMFPTLTTLHLREADQLALCGLEPLPPSLVSLTLSTASQGIDCAALLRSCMTHHLRKLAIGSARGPSSVLAAFRFFERFCNGQWILSLYGDSVSLQTPPLETQSPQYFIICLDASSWPTYVSDILPLCTSMTELHLHISELRHLCTAHAIFPALASAAVVFNGRQDYEFANSLQSGIEAPVLRSITLSTGVRREFDRPVGTLLAPILHAFRSPRLSSVVVQTFHPWIFLRADFAALEDATERVEIHDRVGVTTQIFVMEEKGSSVSSSTISPRV